MVNNNSYTYLSACIFARPCITVAAAIIYTKFLLPGQKIPVAWAKALVWLHHIARCKGPVLYPSCHARMKKSITLFHIMSCMHVTLLSCNMWVTSGSYSYGGLHQSGLFCGSVHGSNKGMQVAMIPALISKGMQAMHHDHSINQTFFEEFKCNNRSSKEAKN